MAVLIIFICFDLVTQTCESLSRIFAENYTATQMIDFAKGDPNNDIIFDRQCSSNIDGCVCNQLRTNYVLLSGFQTAGL